MWHGQGQSHQRKATVQSISDPVRKIKGLSTDVFETLQTKIYLHGSSLHLVISEIFYVPCSVHDLKKKTNVNIISNAQGHVTNAENFVRLLRGYGEVIRILFR